MKRILSLVLFMATTFVSWAHDIEVANADGVTIYYNYSDDGQELIVTYRGESRYAYGNEYIDKVIIPEEVTYMGVTRKVTSIGDDAFCYCWALTSIEIPNSVTSIGDYAFYQCEGLTDITIPNSVTSIGERVFEGCSEVTAVSVEDGNPVYDSRNNCNAIISTANNELICGFPNTVIPNSVTSIGDDAFCYCEKLTEITIPGSVTSIAESSFAYCSGLTAISVEDGNPVYDSRNNCNAIISTANNELICGCRNTVIPKSVTSIGEGAFQGCTGLTSIEIPNNVTSIGFGAFYYCTGLTSVTMGSGVVDIGERAFDFCDNLTDIFSFIEEPFIIVGKDSYFSVFPSTVYNNATLYIPKGTIDKYKATEGWKDFLFFEEVNKRCATPTIAFKDGKITFDCETEDVTFVYSFKSTSVDQMEGNDVSLPSTYMVSVYAKKDEYQNSETVTEVIDAQKLMGDMNSDGVLSVTDVGILITKILKGE